MKAIDRLLELIEDWKFMTRRYGIKSALPTVGSEIIELPYRHLKFLIVACSLIESFPHLKPKIDLKIRPFVETDLALVREINRPSEANLCARRHARGQKGLVAFHQDQLIGYAWGCTEVDPELERVQLKLESGDVLFTDVYTTPSFRGLGVQTALTRTRFQVFRDMGYRRAICYIEVNNAASLAVWQKKFASQTIGEIDFIRFGPRYKVEISCDGLTRVSG